MPVFASPHQPDKRYFEALVLAVDVRRNVCKIQTDHGQAMEGVPWVSNLYDDPEFADKVLVVATLGYPIIVGVLPKVGLPSEVATPIDTGEATDDTGNYSALSQNLVNNPDKPGDILGGDRVFSNSMGGLFGLLRGGTFIAKASRLAQILISKYDDLVRIVARNFEVFTDATVDVISSVRGRIYRFRGYADTLANSRSDVYKYQETYGDTVLANSLKWNYYGLDPASYAAQPVADAIIRKYRIVSGVNTLFFQDLYYDSGRIYTKVQDTATTAYTYVDQTNATFDVKTDDGTTFTRIQTTPSNVTVTFNGTNTNTIVVDNSKIELLFNGSNDNKFTIDNGKLELSFNGTNILTIDSTKLELSYGGLNKVTVDATKAEMIYNGGAHFVRVSSTGLNMG